MNKNEHKMLYSYLTNNLIFLEEEKSHTQQFIRYRSNLSSLDFLEYLIANERLQAFQEFSKNVMQILKYEK